MSKWLLALGAFLAASSCLMPPRPVAASASCSIEWIVLGVAQDAGIPQIGNRADAAWKNPKARRLAVSAALVDHDTGQRFLFEATPDMREQIQRFDTLVPPRSGPLGLSGVFLTHAHIGHYAGLMFAGRESANTTALPVYAMPRFRSFLDANGPWSQLVSIGNIKLQPLENARAQTLTPRLSVTPMIVPHRDEFSETVGFRIETPDRALIFIPDIDSWDQWKKAHGQRIEDIVADVDYAFVDATFFDDQELPGRDMREIPHPRVTDTMARFADAAPEIRARVHFIHFNHTNPLRDPASEKAKSVRAAGYAIAEEGQRVCLSR